MKHVTLQQIADSGHGWLIVPRRVGQAIDLATGVFDRISVFSYLSPAAFYFEEDCDFGVFVDAAKAAGYEVHPGPTRHAEVAECRSFPAFDPALARVRLNVGDTLYAPTIDGGTTVSIRALPTTSRRFYVVGPLGVPNEQPYRLYRVSSKDFFGVLRDAGFGQACEESKDLQSAITNHREAVAIALRSLATDTLRADSLRELDTEGMRDRIVRPLRERLMNAGLAAHEATNIALNYASNVYATVHDARLTAKLRYAEGDWSVRAAEALLKIDIAHQRWPLERVAVPRGHTLVDEAPVLVANNVGALSIITVDEQEHTYTVRSRAWRPSDPRANAVLAVAETLPDAVDALYRLHTTRLAQEPLTQGDLRDWFWSAADRSAASAEARRLVLDTSALARLPESPDLATAAAEASWAPAALDAGDQSAGDHAQPPGPGSA